MRAQRGTRLEEIVFCEPRRSSLSSLSVGGGAVYDFIAGFAPAMLPLGVDFLRATVDCYTSFCWSRSEHLSLCCRLDLVRTPAEHGTSESRCIFVSRSVSRARRHSADSCEFAATLRVATYNGRKSTCVAQQVASTSWFKLNDGNPLPHECRWHYLLECHIPVI